MGELHRGSKVLGIHPGSGPQTGQRLLETPRQECSDSYHLLRGRCPEGLSGESRYSQETPSLPFTPHLVQHWLV